MTRAAAKPRLSVERLDDRITPAAISAVGSPAGSPPVITVYDAATQQQKFTITAFDSSFTGGVSVAVGDVNGDGTPDVIAGAGPGGGSAVNVYTGTDGSLINTYTVGDADSRAGVTVAAADFNADGRTDLVVGAMRGGAPLVQVLNGADGSVLQEYTPFAGVSAPSVAAGDVNGDGTPDVVVGSGAGGAPRVVAFDGKTEDVLADFFAFEQTFVGGVTVATGDLNGDGAADIIAAAGKGGGPRIQAFDGDTEVVLLNFFAYDINLRDGVTASAADTDSDGSLDIVTRDGSGQNGVGAFDGRTGAALTAPSFSAPPAGPTDTTAPTITITSSATTTTKVSPIPFTVTFGEVVNGFTVDDLTVTNGTVGGFAQSGNAYTFTVTPTAAGAVTVAVAAGAATDAAGNANAAATATRTYSTSTPTVTATALTTNDSTPTLTGTVDDPAATVSVKVSAQTVVTTVAATVSGTTWTATIPAALAAGTYDIAVSATDASGRTGTATRTGGLVIDLTAPTVAVSTSAPEPTKTSPIPVTVTFSEDVTGFAASDVTVSNGTVGAITAVDGKTYTFSVTPTGQGAVTVSVAAGVAADAAGNASVVSNTLTRTFDSTAPTVTLVAKTTNDTTPTLTGTVASAATVSVAVGGQTVAATISGSTWTATIPTALAAGTYTVTVTATDAAGNTNTATNAAGLILDLTAPTAVVTTVSDLTNAALIPFTVTFSEPVANLTAAAVTAAGGTVLSINKVSATVFTVNVTPNSDAGTVTLTVPAGATADTAGNATAAPATKSVTSDRVDPTATVTTTDADPATANPLTFTVTFSEAVTGFTADDATVVNGSVLAVTAVDAKTYTVTVVPAATGAVTLGVSAGAAADAAGNGNTAADPAGLTFSGTAIAAAVAATVATPTNSAAIPFTVTFTADVTGFEAADLVVTNGTVGSFVEVDAKTYTFTVAPTADGLVTVRVPAGAATGAGTPASGASITVLSDRTAPTAVVTAGTSTGLNPITFTMTFNEDVSAPTAAALTATNGTIGTVTTVNAKTYTVVVTPAAGGAVTLTVPAGAVSDTTGNATAAAFTGTANPGTDSAGLSATLPTFTGAGVTTQTNGLKIKDVTVGTGTAVAAGQTILAEYTLWLTDGTKVQTSVGNGGPISFSLNGVIQGWQEGIVGMKPGGIRELYVPAALGYGNQAQNGIPANSDLVFAVKLISIS